MYTWLSRYFIPNSDNRYAPHILQKAAVLMMVVLIALTFALSNIFTLLWQSSDWLIATVLPAVIVDLTNEERDQYGEPVLMRSETLDRAARLKAEHMAQNSYFAHFAPDGTSPWYWFAEVEYQYVHAGENLAIHFSESDEVVEAWMKSPTHKKNIVDKKFTEIGVGTARGTYNGFDTVYVVQLFGTPRQQVVATVEPTPTPVTTPKPIVLPASTHQEPEPVLAPTEPEPAEPILEPDSIKLAQAEEVILEVTPFTSAENLEPATNNQTDTAVSELITTTTESIPVAIGSTEPPQQQSRFLERVLTAPSGMLEAVYLSLSLMVLLALMLSIAIEWRRQHPVQIAYGFLLLLLMGGLYYTHITLTSGAVIA